MRQPNNIPEELILPNPGANSNSIVEPETRSAVQEITIDALDHANLKSNRELIKEMKSFLRRNRVTTIEPIENRFMVYLDYTLICDKEEIEHNCLFRPMNVMDMVEPLGVGTNDECVYRRVKVMTSELELRVKSPVPHGIMERGAKKARYMIRINNLIVFQDTIGGPNFHESTYETPYAINSSIPMGTRQSQIPIYSTDEEGIAFNVINLGFVPRRVVFKVKMNLPFYMVVYNNETINEILRENQEWKRMGGPDIPEEEGDDEGHVIPYDDHKPSADGDETPDEQGRFDYYDRIDATHPEALEVVEDNLEDSLYYPDRMIHKRDVIKDIPDIEVGEYVRYNEVMDYSDIF